jgi:hypothetical protein
MLPSGHGNMFLQIISASITPAVLILAAGSLVNSTLIRLSRIVDRARMLMERLERERAAGDRPAFATTSVELRRYSRRAGLTERALSLYYTAIGLFVAGGLAIAIDDLTHDAVPWLSLLLVVGGALALFVGTAALVIETNVATGALKAEIGRACSAHMPPGDINSG